MPHLASFQEPVRSASQGALFLLPKQAQWSPGPKRVSANVTDWPIFAVALREPLESIRTWQEVGASTVRVPQAVIQWLERLYTFKERSEVLWFLDRYPFLASLLLEAYYEIEKHFPYSQVFLEVVTDPEEIDDYQLVASIATNFAPNEAVDRLEQFDEDWWLDALDRAQSKLCIDVEF
ncbi:MAG: hypothetical protein H8E47_13495 [Anaerolineales bacterium]|nr:hypothetical protein [Anaerolineales bacterium]